MRPDEAPATEPGGASTKAGGSALDLAADTPLSAILTPSAGDAPRAARISLGEIVLFASFYLCLIFTLLSVLRGLHLDFALWPANALAAGIFLLAIKAAPRWCTLALTAASLVAHLLVGDSQLQAGAAAIAAGTSFYLIVEGCRHADLRPGGPFDVRHVAWLLVVALCAGIPGALIGAAATISEHGGPFWPTMLRWWLPDMAAVILLLPLFLLWPQRAGAALPARAAALGRRLPRVTLECAVAGAALVGAAGLAAATQEPLLVDLGACILLWFAFRLGPFLTALAASVFGAMVLALTIAGTWGAPGADRSLDMLKAQGRLVLAACPALIIAAIMAQRDRQQRALVEDKRRLAYALEGANDGIWDWHLPTDVIFFSTRAYRMLGYNPDTDAEIVRNFRELIHPEDMPQVKRAFREHMVGRHRLYQIELRARHRSGSYVWLLSRGKVVERNDAGGPIRAVGTITDISQKKHLEAALEHAASHDPLTGLANRATFDRALEQAHRRLNRDLAPFAVLLIDVDHFKGVNDVHGHVAGDVLLTTTARRLQSALRAGDIAARFGGDEFAVIALGKSPEEFVNLANRLHRHLSRQVETEGLILPASFSIGMAVARRPDVNPATLVSDADAALYLAKASGRGTWRAVGLRTDADGVPASEA